MIYIVTDRQPLTEDYIAQELLQYDITWHEIKITRQKAKLILKEGITVLFDDVDKYFSELPPSVAVFKIRQKYNWDFQLQRWLDENNSK